MKVAIVILNWNGRELLQKFLPAVVLHSAEADIYVADNASSDDSIAFISENFPSVRIIRNRENFGFALGYNEALKSVDADIFALVNSDVLVTQNWLDPIIAEFKCDQQISIIQPKIKDYKNRGLFEYAGAAGGFIDKYGYPFCRGRIFESIETDHGQYDDNCTIFWATGACMFVRKEVFASLNGFDADFFAHQEEIDFCWRAYNLGMKARYVAQSVVYHVGGATLNVSHPRKTFLNFRNSLLMLHKNLPGENLYAILFVRLILDGIAGVRFLFQGKPRHMAAVIQAHFSFYRLFSSNHLKRHQSQKGDYFAVNSIVKNYFLRKISKYNKLF